MGVPILIGFFTKKDAARQSGSVQDSIMTAYHDLFFISFILSVFARLPVILYECHWNGAQAGT